MMEPAAIESAAQTVCDIAAHMNRLRESAIEFHAEFDTGDRGYFSPSEDEAVLHLWVSYQKSRGALLDLIATLRQQTGGASEETIVEFTIGYGAAVILIDAARFLRDLFGEDKIVRRKLNESYEAYGIPAGSFDAIQLSLTDPGNAVGIKRANTFYDQHGDDIRQAASEHEALGPVLDVIDFLAERVQVSKSRYVKVRIDERRRQLNDAIVRSGLMRMIYAIQEWGSRAVSSVSTIPGHVPNLPDTIAAEVRGLLRPGDVFITRKESALTNYFLPGYWPHAAMYIGDDQVIESLKDGVRERALDSPFGNDAVSVIRPLLSEVMVGQSIQRARTHLGKPYDFDFDFTRSDRLVCTEVVYRSYEGIGGITFQLSPRAGRQTLSAEDLLNLALKKENFQLVAVYCPKHSKELLTDDQMIDVLKDTMEAAAV